MPRETKRPTNIDGADLPELTPNRMSFVKAILQGMTASDAYRHSYDTENWSDEAIWVEASRTKSDPKVALWLATARREGLANTVITLESHVSELDSLKQEARQAGAYGAAIKAEELKGRANGLYVERIKTEDGTEISLINALAKLQASEPALATAIAQSMGLELPGSDISGADNLEQVSKH